MESKKINQLATEMSPATSDLTIIGDPITGVSKKITLLQIADLFATTGTVSSVAVTETGDALTITGSPITSAGTINIGFAGDATQYVRGDGALADFPTSTGGGSSVSYYLNSSVSQGTIGGVDYREFSKDPIAGAGTDITASTNGYIASYLTDANDPALLEVPAGNFNCEFYFSVNSNAHNPYVYAEVYKYDGSTFTLIGSSVSVPEYLTNGTTLSPYYFAIPVAQTVLAITDRIAIRIYANVDTREVTLHTENNHLCQVVTTFSKGLTSLNNLTRQVQFLATGTSGTDFNISSSTATHTFNLPVASATNTGKLSSTDWTTFNNKQPAGNYVTLDTTQTISGVKTFTTSNLFTGANLFTNFSQRFNQGVAILETANFGATVDYTTIVGAVNGLALRLSSDGKKIFAFADATTNNTFTFPNATGTIALTSNLSSYVPYTGATANVTLGLFDLYAQNVFATDTSGNWLAALSRDTATAIGTLVLKSGGFTNYLQPITTVSSARTWTLPDASGTIALTSNLHNPVTIGTANGLSLSTQVLSLALASTSANGALSSTDWNTFNGKQNALTNPITGTGTRSIYYIPVFSGSDTTIENSIIQQVSSNIGIGVSPSFKLDVNGTGRFSDALNGTSATFSSTVQASAYRLTGMTAGSGALYWSSDRVTLANYNATGLVVIEANGGTVTSTFGGATYNNDFVGTGRFTGALTGTSATFTSGLINGTTDAFFDINRSASGNAGRVRFQTAGTDEFEIGLKGGVAGFHITKGDATELLTIASTGAATFSNNLAVGGSTDDTSGGLYSNIALNGSTYSRYSLLTGGTARARFQFDGTNTTLTTTSTGGKLQLATFGAAAMEFVTNDSLKMTITSGGNVGIGVTPAAWGTSSIKALQIGTFGSLAWVGGVDINLFNNAYYDGTNFKYIASQEAARYLMNRNNHHWYIAAAGSADGNISFIEAARINSSGYAKFTSTGSFNDANAANHEFVNGTASANSFFIGNTNTSYSGATLLRINGSRTTTNATYNLIGATNGNSTGEFLVRDSGNCLNTNNSYTGTSDIKLKQDIIDASSQWEDIKQMRIRKFRFKKQVEQDENAPYLLGVIAQELELISPNLVDEALDFDGTGEEVTSTTKSVKYSIIYMKAVKALQEAMAKIEILEDKVKQLENK